MAQLPLSEASPPYYIGGHGQLGTTGSVATLLLVGAATGIAQGEVEPCGDTHREEFARHHPRRRIARVDSASRNDAGRRDHCKRRMPRTGSFGLRTPQMSSSLLNSTSGQSARNMRRAILIVSDGGDNHSHMTARQVRNDVLKADLQTYAIRIFDDSPDRKLAPEEINGPDRLRELSDETRGRHYRVDELDDLVAVAGQISTDLRNEYLVGYVSTNGVRDGKYRRVTVNADSPSTKTGAIHRRGYYAPGEYRIVTCPSSLAAIAF